jgi:hypothetical protein
MQPFCVKKNQFICLYDFQSIAACLSLGCVHQVASCCLQLFNTDVPKHLLATPPAAFLRRPIYANYFSNAAVRQVLQI